MNVPLLDLQAQHDAIRPELEAAIARVVADGRYIGGPELEAFEERFAAYCRAQHAIGVSSGTDALTVGLIAAGVKPGDEVITTPFTFIATVESILLAGATPVLVDVDPDTALMTPEAAEAAITERTTAIAVVHLYGQTVDLDSFRELCDRRGLILAEDAAQAHGAEWKGKRAGSVGDVAAFSFFPGKNLGALGDAGGITTNDPEIAGRARRYRDHGRTDKYTHAELGTNARMDALQAAVLSVKLERLDEWTEARRAHAAAYTEALPDGVPLRRAPEALHSWHQYVVRTGDRDAVAARLREQGIASGVHYPIPLHKQPALQEIAGGLELPNSERLGQTVLSLPVFPELDPADRARIARLVVLDEVPA
ncbi:MAG TPA: DegT/DnrJ/EryC1/StrS family aminotransferase [Thermoleophilaceae bacterium]|nr:DegT/DnrJ/EryC1/StrS family aminotransferase [Thermoleophilaceae bacterium]